MRDTDSAVGFLQVIVNQLYEAERSRGNFDFARMLENAPRAGQIALVVGKLYQQVNNGGFAQWYWNGYAGDSEAYLEDALKEIGGESAAAVDELVRQAFARDVLESIESDDEFETYGGDVLDGLDTKFYDGLGANLMFDCAQHIAKHYLLKGAENGS